MNLKQEQMYKKDAEEVETELRLKGYISTDVVGVAYFLLEKNIDRSEQLHAKDKEINALLNRASNLLKSC